MDDKDKAARYHEIARGDQARAILDNPLYTESLARGRFEGS